ncbi:MAG TPA: 1-deoxy-D-xylulose-5-phosphate reductoisomerase [Candidatus Omnitrophica bacterium]|nr:1-deoxy-D-xylulose-5-phosphate reductoisomerase [Candidatus Omnitrophota bacterium]
MPKLKKQVIILGSTGSIGKNTLDVISRNRSRFSVLGLSANSNTRALFKQIRKFKPRYVAVTNIDKARELEKKLDSKIKVLKGDKGLARMVAQKSDIVVMAMGGSSALLPMLKAVEATKCIALANKEALVMAGALIMKKAKQKKVAIIPIDSEQSAIFQCIRSKDRSFISKIYLTASGGPLKDISAAKLKYVTPERAINHPRWKMGKKISIDSATLMNKGLELIEAMWLFNLPADKIDILVHKQSIMHSMVEFIDGSALAQLAIPDMRIPIQYSLTYPERLSSGIQRLDLTRFKNLTFEKPDYKKFPCLRLARNAAKLAGSAPCVLNAANEEAVKAFLDKRINFTDIPKVIGKVLKKHRLVKHPNLAQILEIDSWARGEVKCLF